MKALVAGWFSFEQMGASAGDLLVRDLVIDWLVRAGCEHDVALAYPFTGGVDWQVVDPARYSHLVFVCGPLGDGPPADALLRRFAGRRLIGVNLTMLDALDVWNPFDLLLERDSSAASRPDLAFLSTGPLSPVAGLILIDAQPEYGERARHVEANAALRRLASRRGLATIAIDTRLDVNTHGLTSAAQVEALIAKTDVVLTTRLHGTVLALKHGVPVLAIDSVAGGGKVVRQCKSVDWPIVFTAPHYSDEELDRALDHCLTSAARVEAANSRHRAASVLRAVADEFVTAMSLPAGVVRSA